jgi:hypothetical protein
MGICSVVGRRGRGKEGWGIGANAKKHILGSEARQA